MRAIHAVLVSALCVTIPSVAAVAESGRPVAGSQDTLRVDRDTRRIYETGLAAVRESRWQAAREEMQGAIDRLPRENLQTDIFEGTRRSNPTPYLPFYYLGWAHFGLGDCAAAREAWATSIDLGALDEDRNETAMRLDGKCRDLLEQHRNAAAEIDAAHQSESEVNDLKQEQRLAGSWQGTRGLGDDEARARRVLGRGTDEMRRADSAPGRGDDPEEHVDERIRAARTAFEDADRARELFDDVANEARQTLFDLQERAAQEAAGTVQEPTSGAENEPGAAEAPPREESPEAATGTTIDTSTGDDSGDPEAIDVPSQPSPAPTSTNPNTESVQPPATAASGGPDLAPAVPGELLAAARDFFSGRYTDAETKLAPISYEGDPEAQAQVLLLRAATRVALYEQSTREDDALHERALEDARSYLALSSELPTVRYFSPKVVELFRAARGGSRP